MSKYGLTESVEYLASQFTPVFGLPMSIYGIPGGGTLNSNIMEETNTLKHLLSDRVIESKHT